MTNAIADHLPTARTNIMLAGSAALDNRRVFLRREKFFYLDSL
jgi:hypothetical protein